MTEMLERGAFCRCYGVFQALISLVVGSTTFSILGLLCSFNVAVNFISNPFLMFAFVNKFSYQDILFEKVDVKLLLDVLFKICAWYFCLIAFLLLFIPPPNTCLFQPGIFLLRTTMLTFAYYLNLRSSPESISYPLSAISLFTP